jgi:hypothetical protein
MRELDGAGQGGFVGRGEWREGGGEMKDEEKAASVGKCQRQRLVHTKPPRKLTLKRV